MGRRFFLAACPSPKIDLCQIDLNRIIVVNQTGSAIKTTGSAAPGKWRRGYSGWCRLAAGGQGLGRGRLEVDPGPRAKRETLGAGLEAMRNKKTPHSAGF
jgi:hypothetical protein